MITNANLNEHEQAALARWLNTRPVKKHTKGGADLAIVFTPGGGIGTVVTATIRNRQNEVISKDITDYGSW